mmetsp:Transcript_17181/g.36947  ORF Transcript_17181/g.36947 Transcript_17181/m.36947 type:complete len:94 (-) Transcript_17181:89-370(-)|eukprot:CAMPEP_0206432580 /NCGR_PEP_ID=MMETSP0324_2-20121206/8039_1 /ASSEMBLY_ACC=CAM_ASM_000836 /TAXON_ID=2866 /ORGANISM="Crypthecodinium cohnii, Strain Seligo" /LENGTH=93 /DNA_ID=CAMNT_0053898715 /DNA_START=26 /DNA_END=307 /DNA_ORIENTATION=+
MSSWPTKKTTSHAPMGFSAAASSAAAAAAAAAASEASRNTVDRTSGEGAESSWDDKELPIEIQPHSYDKLLIKEYTGLDGPWFCYAWADRQKR